MTGAATKERGSGSPGRRPRSSARSNGKPAERSSRRSSGQGGKRLAAAFDSVSAMPALAEVRHRALHASEGSVPSADEVAAAIESDAALAIQVMRAANDRGGRHGRTRGVREAVDVLTIDRIRLITEQVATYDPFEHPNATTERHERFRRHAVATRHAAERIAELARLADRDELAVAALLHDVGKLVLAELHGPFTETADERATPDERIRHERRELGIDHALVGAVLVRRWALAPSVAATIERHHSARATGHAAAIRLADLIVHCASGDPVPPNAIVDTADQLGLERDAVVPLLYEFPHSGAVRKRNHEHGWI